MTEEVTARSALGARRTAKATDSSVAPIGEESRKELPRELLRAIERVRAVHAVNQISNRALYDYAYHERRGDQESMARIAASEGLDQLTEAQKNQMLRPYRDAVKAAFEKTQQVDIQSIRLARSGREAYTQRRLLNCLDHAKAVGRLALDYGMDPDDIKLFVTMDVAGFDRACPIGEPEPQASRPIVHTLVAYRHNDRWSVVNVETDLNSPELEIVPLQASKDGPFPARNQQTFEFEQAPLVKGLTLVSLGEAGVFSFEDRAVSDAINNQLLINITLANTRTVDPADARCDRGDFDG